MRSLCPLDTWLDKKPPHVLTTHPHHERNNAAAARRLTAKQSCPEEEKKKRKSRFSFSVTLAPSIGRVGIVRGFQSCLARRVCWEPRLSGLKLARCSFYPHDWVLIDKFAKLVPSFSNGILLCLLDLPNL